MKKNIKYQILIPIIILLFGANDIYSQQSGGGYSQSYLFRNVGARAVAMGGAYTAIANEPNGIFYNPAGLAFLPSKPYLSTYFSLLGLGRTQSAIAWGQEVTDRFGVGFGLNSMFSGTFMARDIKGNPIGEITNMEYTFVATGSYRIEFASLGASLKYINNNLTGSEYYGQGYSLDVGTKFDVLNMFTVGVAVQNVSALMFWNTPSDENEALPYQVRTGIAMEYGLNDRYYETRSTVTGELENVYEPATRYILIGIDAIFNQFQVSPNFVLGIEAVPHELIAFRGGIGLYGENLGTPQLLPMNIWGGGISIRPDMKNYNVPFLMHFDYTISNDYISDSGISHHFSLFFEF